MPVAAVPVAATGVCAPPPPLNIAPWCQHLARSRAEWNRRKRNNSVTRRADAPTVYIRRAAVGSSSGSSVAIVGSFRS
jgi:hypothetical protein